MTIPLRSISVFHAAARSGSITRAAAELGVTPSAVSQQIHLLEAHIGTALMTKAGRGVMLTEAGERYFAKISDEFDRIEEATQEARGFRSVTTLMVRGTPTLLTKWLLPRLGGFLDAHPNMHVRVDAATEHTDFTRDAVDLEIRHGDGRYPGLFTEGFAEERFWPVCAPALLPRATLAASEVTSHRMIHSLKSQIQWSRWFGLNKVSGDGNRRRVLFDRSHMAIDAAANGLGIALESDLMTWRELRDGALICPVRDPPHVVLTTQWIVCTQQAVQTRKVKLFLDWLRLERDRWQASASPAPP
jgi:LysR family glycine cleavage system transcriptional activator